MKAEFKADGRIISLFREAMEAAERLDDPQRMHVRASIGAWLQRFGLGAEFGNYAADAVGARDRFFRELYPPYSKREAEREEKSTKLREVEAEAKRRFASGDLSGAREVYLFAEDLRDDHIRSGVLGANVQFLDWKLETGDLSGAVEFFRSVDWQSSRSRIEMACRIAAAYDAAGNDQTDC